MKCKQEQDHFFVGPVITLTGLRIARKLNQELWFGVCTFLPIEVKQN